MSRDDERRRVRVEDSYGVRRLGFDQAYRPTDITDALGRIKEDVYDFAGNVLSTPATSPQTTNSTMDSNTSTVRRIRAGQEKIYKLDSLGRITEVFDSRGTSVRFEYDRGRVTSLRDSGNTCWEYTYDDRGIMCSMRDPLGFKITLLVDRDFNPMFSRTASAFGKASDTISWGGLSNGPIAMGLLR